MTVLKKVCVFAGDAICWGDGGGGDGLGKVGAKLGLSEGDALGESVGASVGYWVGEMLLGDAEVGLTVGV